MVFSKKTFGLRRTKVVVAAATLVAVLALSAYAYYTLLLPQRGPRASITSQPLEFSIELNKAEFQQGENLTMIYTLTNLSNETVVIEKSYPMNPVVTESQGTSAQPEDWLTIFHFGYSVTDVNGTEIARVVRGFVAVAYTLRIESGGYIKQTVFWNGPLDRGPLPSGAYQIRGVYSSISVNGALLAITLETPTITFTIR